MKCLEYELANNVPWVKLMMLRALGSGLNYCLLFLYFEYERLGKVRCVMKKHCSTMP